MKRILAVVFAAVLLCGCSGTDGPTEKAIELRQSLLDAKGCSFACVITADYGDTSYEFMLECTVDTSGKMMFRVLSPESISGISGTVDQQTGSLTFDGKVLAFPLLAEGELSPVCAPWLFYKALTGGYIRSCGEETDRLRITIDDSFQEESLQLDVWTEQGIPVGAEIMWQGRKLLSLEIQAFRIL